MLAKMVELVTPCEADPKSQTTPSGRAERVASITRTTELLSDRDTIDLLLQVGLLNLEEIVAGQIEVHRSARRNHNFQVKTGSGKGFFVKQAGNPTASITLRNEAEALGLRPSNCREDLNHHMPRLLYYDPDRNVMVTELLSSRSLLGHGFGSTFELRPQQIAFLGRALAEVHRDFAARATGRSQCPLGVSLHKPSLELYRNSSRRNVQFLATLQRDEILCEHLLSLNRSWQLSSFIHGDVKFDNVVVNESASGGTPVLVDWEFSGLGDPRWDVGSAVGELLYIWLVDAVNREIGQGDSLVNERRARRSMEQLRLLTITLFQSYGEAAGHSLGGTFEAECFGYSVARLLQTTYELGQSSNELDLYAVKTIQMASNMAARPDASLELFLNSGAPS